MKITPVSRFTVNGNSMLPTLNPGQDIVSFNWAYLGKKPRIGDIVVIKLDNREMVKRIKRINGDEITVEGDNEKESIDSRHFGPVAVEQIVGQVIYRFDEIPCPNCGSPVTGIYGRKDAICKNCGFKLTCCGEP